MFKNVLEKLLGKKERLIKKYVMDEKGQLKLYSPEVQVALLTVLRGGTGNLDDLLLERDEEEKANKDC